MKSPPSTIAMSAYSVTALFGPMTAGELLNAFVLHRFECAPEDLDSALAAAIERGLITTVGDKFYAAGPAGWVAWQRREDLEGWTGWICRNIKTGQTMPLEQLRGAMKNA